MGRVWFTADWHLGHRLVAEIRGFGTDMAAHDDTVVGNALKVIRKKDDQLWILGDLTMGRPEPALERLAEIPGRKHLICGNHDACWPGHPGANRMLRRYLDGFDSVQPFARRRMLGREVLLSHFPYGLLDRGPARYTQYRLPDHGRILLHGHTHGKERLHGHQIHVGLDAWDLEPVPIEAVLELIRQIPALSADGPAAGVEVAAPAAKSHWPKNATPSQVKEVGPTGRKVVKGA